MHNACEFHRSTFNVARVPPNYSFKRTAVTGAAAIMRYAAAAA